MPKGIKGEGFLYTGIPYKTKLQFSMILKRQNKTMREVITSDINKYISKYKDLLPEDMQEIE